LFANFSFSHSLKASCDLPNKRKEGTWGEWRTYKNGKREIGAQEEEAKRAKGRKGEKAGK